VAQDINVHVKRDGCCGGGCVTLFLIALVVGIPLEAWESANLLGRVGIIAGALILIAGGVYFIVWQSKKNNAKAEAEAARKAPPALAPGFSGAVSHQPLLPMIPQKVAAAAAPSSVPEEIRKLAELRDSGILTEAEFQAKKAELLARM
jgi:cell division protein FtsN